MEQKPRWAEMCAQILKQCETVRGGRESLAAFLGVHPTQVAIWVERKIGPAARGVREGDGDHPRRARSARNPGAVGPDAAAPAQRFGVAAA